MNVPARGWRLIGGMAFNAMGDRQIHVDATTQSGPPLERGETIEVVPLSDHENAVSLLAMIGQCANTHDALDEDRMVRVPLRLVRAARDVGQGAG